MRSESRSNDDVRATQRSGPLGNPTLTREAAMRPHLHIGRDRAAGATSTWDATLGLGELSPRIRALLIFIIAAALSGLLLIIAASLSVRASAVRVGSVD